MPLAKRSMSDITQNIVQTAITEIEQGKDALGTTVVALRPMTKDDYWRSREERDIKRDKDMAWSGLAQAALGSVGIVQLNTTNTLEGFVELVVKATDLLLQARDKRNS